MVHWVKPLAIAVVAVTLTSVYFIDFCDAIYQCGCDHLWAGAAAKCNIHNPTGRHCPWCSVGPAGYYLVFGAIVAPQVLLAFRPRRWGWTGRLLASLAAFPVAGGLIGLVMGFAMGYWK